MSEDLLALLYASLVLGSIILASFILWFQFRDRPGWDTLLFGLASVSMGVIVGIRYLPRNFEQKILSYAMIPWLLIYLWFGGLWLTRRERAAIYQWGIQNGYHITGLDRTYELGPGGSRLVAGYRIVARRISDGQIRIGHLRTGSRSTSGQGFDVLWQSDVPIQHLHRPKEEESPSNPND